MKSEERHELQKNELNKMAFQATALYDRYQNQILWTLVVILLITAGWIYWTRSSRVAAESAWTSTQAAQSPNDYLDVAIQHPNSSAAPVAKLQAAFALLEMGVQESFRAREQANVKLKDAKRAFEELTAAKGLPGSIREQALMGEAKVLESISSGETEAAIAAYEKLLSEFPESLYKTSAEDRIKDLKKKGTQEFLAWYHKQNPKPPEQPKPQDGQGPGANVGAPKPGAGDGEGLSFPAPPKSDAVEKSEEKGAEAPKADDKAAPVEPSGPALPTETAPSTESAPPASEKPAESEAPVEKK